MSGACRRCGGLIPLPVLGEINARTPEPDAVRFKHEVSVRVSVEARVKPREAPPLEGNPDRPAFHDAGEPGEVEVLAVELEDGRVSIPLDALGDDELEGIKVIAAHIAGT